MALTAASPEEATITVSAIPMVTARNCSIIRGMMSFDKNCGVNIASPEKGRVCAFTN
jgi:hypothetical protein